MTTRSATILLALTTISLSASAQSAIDAYSLSRQETRGTARFMSMGGAFTALGGDMSTLSQNPGGLGIYRSSEISATLDIDFQKTSADAASSVANNKTNVSANAIGYIGSFYTGSEAMPFFNIGFSYGRTASFNRAYKANLGQLSGSLSNYIAGYTSAQPGGLAGFTPGELSDTEDNGNPYLNSNAPWMSILAYNAYMINPLSSNTNTYSGLWQNGTTGTGNIDVVEKGQVDEYNIDLGGNIYNTVYWGLGFGFTDINYTSSKYYEEDFSNAAIPPARGTDGIVPDGTVTGGGGYGLDSYKNISGSGFNFKIGVIVKPINELRIGLAVHTPTYYSLTSNTWGGVDYGFNTVGQGYTQTNRSYYDPVDWKLRTPWRLMAGVAGVIGSQAIVSLDYEYRPNQAIRTLTDEGYEMESINGDIKNYYRSTNIVRLGAEYRVTPGLSLRAGYSYESSPVTADFKDGQTMVYTSGYYDMGTDPSYEVADTRQNVSVGLGYRYKMLSIDLAYVNSQRKSEFHAYTPNAYTAPAPSAKITDTDNRLVMTLGFRF